MTENLVGGLVRVIRDGTHSARGRTSLHGRSPVASTAHHIPCTLSFFSTRVSLPPLGVPPAGWQVALSQPWRPPYLSIQRRGTLPQWSVSTNIIPILLYSPPAAKDPPEHRPSLHLDASKFNIDPHTDDAPSTPSTPPHTRPRAHTQSDPVPPPQVRSRAATIANPPKSAPPGGPPEREKRKRSRVTPEQLAHLERIFAVDKSPTAAKRKEISEMLGMQERQTQIWFQNRCVPPPPRHSTQVPPPHVP